MKVYNYGTDDLSRVWDRSQLDDKDIIRNVESIVDSVRMHGNKSLFEYISRFDNDNVNADNLIISEAEIDEAISRVEPQLLEDIKVAVARIKDYHYRQTSRYSNHLYDNNGVEKLGWIYRPLLKVAVYAPGGKASYPSTVMMCALPAICAGVKEVVVATPNPSNPLILAACRECGVSKVYRMGGAHAIAALAFGTESVEKVDLIAGPGNVYVTMAKKLVYGHVGIDMIAGPSEVLVIADESADKDLVIADLLAQAEHDEMAASILVTTDRVLADYVAANIYTAADKLPRKEIISKSLRSNGAIIIVKDCDEALEVSDRIAPEHLEIATINAAELAMRINNAGAIFVGNYSSEPYGDYIAGPSHCLPTSGSARYFSVLSVDTFMKKISYIECSESAFARKDAQAAVDIAVCEGLQAHANSIKLRMKK